MVFLKLETTFAANNVQMPVLKIAVQKSGRLSEDSTALFQKCGISFDLGKTKLLSPARNFPAEFLFLRDDDIPGYVEDGVADIGIVGHNVLVEKGNNVVEEMKLGFSKCRLSLAVPKEVLYTDVRFFNNKRIATSYPKLLEKFLNSRGIKAEIHEISGSVEIAPGIGLADGVCDIVSSGGTLLSNGLKEVEAIFYSEAILVSNKELDSDKRSILERLIFRIQAVQRAAKQKYILLNAPNEKIEDILKQLPGMRSPTVLPLAQSGWSSVHSVVPEQEFWEKIEDLRAAGAEGILVVPIEKMIY